MQIKQNFYLCFVQNNISLENSQNQERNRQIEKDSVLEDIQNQATNQLSTMSFQGYLMRLSKIHAINNSKCFVVVFKAVLRPILMALLATVLFLKECCKPNITVEKQVLPYLKQELFSLLASSMGALFRSLCNNELVKMA